MLAASRIWFALRIALLLAFIVGLGFVAARVLWPPTESSVSFDSPTSFPLDALIREDLASGWRVKHFPDLPGPYRRRLDSWLHFYVGPNCFVRLKNPDGSIIWEEKIGAKQEYLTLKFETMDGQIAHGLLIREE